MLKARPIVKVNSQTRKIVAKRATAGCGCGKNRIKGTHNQYSRQAN
ncbi:hypothetical protein [Paucisalibacillus globulus]|nr:hypothetical protein [Paucisalibacillus globulus]